MDFLHLKKLPPTLRGDIRLDGSKSISNRALIVTALAGGQPADWLQNLSTSKDTQILRQLLENQHDTFDAGDAGTTFRFLTAYLATRPGTQILTGSERMRERPVGPLVQALQSLGADIQFLEKDGYPPLRIGPFRASGQRSVRIHAGTSSQFLSALLMVGPYLPDGLELVPDGPLVSRPYLQMTLKLMQHFGAQADWSGDKIVVQPIGYQLKPLAVEADWSAASYWYAMAAFAENVDLKLRGLFTESWQGDSVLAAMMTGFGIETTFEPDGIRLRKSGQPPKPIFEKDFTDCPDIAQTLAVVCAGLGVKGVFSGLETLAIKETDRIAALKNELKKVGVSFAKLPPHFSKKQPDRTFYLLDGKAAWAEPPRFASYGDHRMAMSFAPLAFFGDIEIANPAVVSKSYPGFWEDLRVVLG